MKRSGHSAWGRDKIVSSVQTSAKGQKEAVHSFRRRQESLDLGWPS